MSLNRKSWEVLVGDYRTLDFLASQQAAKDDEPHPLQALLEELVDTVLTEREKIVYFMRFGERASHREIAERMGYRSHRIIQIMEERIIEKVRKALEAYRTGL